MRSIMPSVYRDTQSLTALGVEASKGAWITSASYQRPQAWRKGSFTVRPSRIQRELASRRVSSAAAPSAPSASWASEPPSGWRVAA